jgi:type I restriction-modification system DNA methylase subunit
MPTSTARAIFRVPPKGRVYDPCCGSGGMFVQSEKFTGTYAAFRYHFHDTHHHFAVASRE